MKNPVSPSESPPNQIHQGEPAWKPSKEDWPKLRHLEGADVPSSELLVFAAIAEFANPYTENWPSWVPRRRGFASWLGVPRICRLTGQSTRAVQYAIKGLELRGAIECIYQSKGGAPGNRTGNNEPAKTNCYLLTPHLVHRLAFSTPQSLQGSKDTEPCKKRDRTLHENHENGASGAPYNPAPDAPELLIHHHQERKERTKEKPNERTSPVSFPDDADERAKRRRAPLEDPFDELALRFRERFGSGADALLRIVLDGISPKRQEVQEFVEFDDTHTGAPQDLHNPGGYYRTLVVNFQLAQANRRERQRLERQRELERQLTAPPDPSPVCALGKCNGRGEVYDNGGISVCECEAGQRLPTAVRETMTLLKRGAA